MHAIISGSAGLAILVDGRKLASLHAEAPTEIIQRQTGDINFLLGESGRVVVLEDVDLNKVRDELALACDSEEALQLFLMLLDPELSKTTRQEAAEALEELLRNATTDERMRYCQMLWMEKVRRLLRGAG